MSCRVEATYARSLLFNFLLTTPSLYHDDASSVKEFDDRDTDTRDQAGGASSDVLPPENSR